MRPLQIRKTSRKSIKTVQQRIDKHDFALPLLIFFLIVIIDLLLFYTEKLS